MAGGAGSSGSKPTALRRGTERDFEGGRKCIADLDQAHCAVRAAANSAHTHPRWPASVSPGHGPFAGIEELGVEVLQGPIAERGNVLGDDPGAIRARGSGAQQAFSVVVR